MSECDDDHTTVHIPELVGAPITQVGFKIRIINRQRHQLSGVCCPNWLLSMVRVSVTDGGDLNDVGQGRKLEIRHHKSTRYPPLWGVLSPWGALPFSSTHLSV